MREADGRARRPTPRDGTRASDRRTGKKFTSAGGSGWRLRLLLTALLVIAAAGSATARPGPFDALPIIEIPLEPEDQRRGGSALSWHAAFDDTVLYGGTVWSPDSMRWEALRDSHWTFDTGVGSSINIGANPNKPVGYHQTMEGWFGIDQTLNPLPYFRRSSTCAISGSFSLWAGVTAGEAGLPCYATGQGYGNNWDLVVSRNFVYSGGGSVAFSFEYAVDAEPSYDFAYAEIDTSGTGAMEPIILWSRDGLVSGVEAMTLDPGSEMRSTPGFYTIRFRASSDGGYSDEDGLYASVCGLAAFDNVVVGSDTTDFEFGMNGWAQELPMTGVGDYSHLADLATLPAPTTFCPCGHADSVLVFFDLSASHPLDQDNIAVSPWIDLLEGGDVGRPGKVILFDVYSEMPLANYVLMQAYMRYFPKVCSEDGLLGFSPFTNDNIVLYFGELPFCNAETAPRMKDLSTTIPPSAELAQLALGIVNLCRTAPYGPSCTGISNSTPWVDNVSLGVYGSPSTPALRASPWARFHDNFAADGTLSPAAPGRFDMALVKNATQLLSGSRLGDTLVAGASGSNVEVRLVFRPSPGPFTGAAALAMAAQRWTGEPGLSTMCGGNWYSARLDTAEQAGEVPTPEMWMTSYHESDPGFSGTDILPDPLDPGQLANDIIPDHIFTPGSRLDYFIAARYIPPDPRNPGGSSWAVIPDTTGARFYEAEILPSSVTEDWTWNCVLYVDHHDDREFQAQATEEATLQAVLGTGSGNAEGTRFDRWDVLYSTISSVSLGRPPSSDYGASLAQLQAYTRIVWHSGSQSGGAFSVRDADILKNWLSFNSADRDVGFWGTGSGLAQSMHNSGGSARDFLNNWLGVLVGCYSIQSAGCPVGTGMDASICIPTADSGPAHFQSSIDPYVTAIPCETFIDHDLLTVKPSVAGVLGQRNYVKNGQSQSFASVTRERSAQSGYPFRRSVLDGFPIARVREGEDCEGLEAAFARTQDVFDWFDAAGVCRSASWPADVPEPPESPAVLRASLGPAHPNPTPGAARLSFVNAAPNARVRLDILDVTGRLIRTLVNGPLAAGPHELSWDGRAADGRLVADGLYFYRMTTNGFTEARKLVVLR